MTATFNCSYGNSGYGDLGYGFLGSLARPATYRRASRADLSAGSGGGRLRSAEFGPATGREPLRRADHSRSFDALGANSSLHEADEQGSDEGQGGQAGAPRSSPSCADADRPPRGSHPLGLSQVPLAGSVLPLLADTIHRGYPPRHYTGGHRAHDSSLLVSPVPRHRRTRRDRRLARLDHRPARRGLVGVASIPAGHHAGADHRRVQLPSPVHALRRRAGVDVAPVAGGPLRLVPGDQNPCPRQCRAARRRDRLAG